MKADTIERDGMARSSEPDNKKKNVRVAEGPRGPGFARTVGEMLAMFFKPLIPLTMLIVVYVGIFIFALASFKR